MTRTAAVAAAVLLASLSACQKKKEVGDKVTATSEANAKQEIVDEDYRFRLAWPGEGWKLLRERDIRRVSPDAVAGMTNDKVWGAVIIEQAPSMELEQFGGLIIDQMEVEERQVIRRERVTYAGVPAIDFVVDGRVKGAPVRFAGRMMLNNGWGYQVLAWSLRSNASDDAFATVFDAFSILPGEVKGRAAVVASGDSAGVGWRLRGGLFESALSGLRARAPAGWNAVTGEELAKLNPSADLGLVSNAPEAYVVVLVERAPGRTLESYRAQRLGEMTVGAATGEPVKASFLGKEIELTRFTAAGQPIEYLFAVDQRGDRMIQLLGWYAAGLRAQAEARVVAGAAAIEALDDAAIAALDRELASAPDTQNAVGPDFALRRGRFLHFGLGLEWTRPDGYWRVVVGQAARAQNANALMVAEDPRRGLHVMLTTEDLAGQAIAPDVYADAVERSAPFTAVSRAVTTLAGSPAGSFDGVSRDDDPKLGGLAYHVTSTTRGGAGLQLWVWGFARDMETQRAEVAAMASRLRAAPELAAVVEGPPYRDHRLGFQMTMPASWRRTDETPPDLAALGTVVTWRAERQVVFVIALCGVTDSADEEWFADFMQQTFIDKLGLAGATAKPAGKEMLAGIASRHIRSESLHGRADMYLLTRDETMFGVLAVDEGGGGGADTTARAAFSLLD